MARKKYFDYKAKAVGIYLRERGFKTHHKTTHTRMTLEVRQGDKGLILINLARKQWVNIGMMFPPNILESFIRTGILPYPKSVKPLSELPTE